MKIVVRPLAMGWAFILVVLLFRGEVGRQGAALVFAPRAEERQALTHVANRAIQLPSCDGSFRHGDNHMRGPRACPAAHAQGVLPPRVRVGFVCNGIHARTLVRVSFSQKNPANRDESNVSVDLDYGMWMRVDNAFRSKLLHCVKIAIDAFRYSL